MQIEKDLMRGPPMLRYLLASTAILAISAPAAAKEVDDRRTAPLRTSTIDNGSADSITVTEDGSVVLEGGTAITMDSNHAVANQGELSITDADGAAGIVAQAGTSGAINNSGTITIDESYEPTDADNDGDLDGPFAIGSDRFGIRTLGAHSGNIVNSGTIKVEGNDSAGIVLGGTQNGAFTHNGTTSVLGDRGIGIGAQDIAGDVRLGGTVAVQGEDSIGAHFAGDITGAMVVDGIVSATGYRYTTPPGDTSKLDDDDLLQGGSALVIEGDVTGGILLARAPDDDGDDDDDEGEDDGEGGNGDDNGDDDDNDDGDEDDDERVATARVQSFGEAPAMVVGAEDRDIAIGPVEGVSPQFGLIVDGVISGSGLYSGVDGNGLVIGGRGGGVTIANGIGISGTVSASSRNAAATALRIGADATVPEIRNSGTIRATSGGSSASVATAVAVDEGADLPVLRNSGTIEATLSGDDSDGTAIAIVDRSGGLTLIENAGNIAATGAEDSDRNIAIDLSANTAGATIRQTEVASGFTAPAITGDILLGSGDDVVELRDGTMKGAIHFGGGSNELALSGDAVQTGSVIFGAGADAMTLGGTSVFSGSVDFGGGADSLSLSGSARFSGSLANAQNLAVDVAGGMLDITRPAAIGSLNIGEDGILAVTLGREGDEGTAIDVGGTASFAEGATLAFRLANVKDAEGRYVVLEAGDLQGASGIETSTDLIPFLFKAELAEDAAANTLAVDVARKTTTELGLNRSQSSAFDAVFAAIGEDGEIEDVFLDITDGDIFRHSVRQMLPDHAGGAFEGVSLGTRAFGRQMADQQSPVYSLGGLDILVNVAGWTADKNEGATAAYDLSGFGGSLSGEVDTTAGAFGLSAIWFWNEYDQGSDANRVLSDTYELAAYWRGKWGGLSTFARGSIGMVDFRGRRTFVGLIGEDRVERNTISEWNGTLMTLSGGASYEFAGGGLFLRPSVSVDYVKLDEDGYTDTGGKGLNLIVDDRSSDEFALNAGAAAGIDWIGSGQGDTRWFRTEAEAGRREIVGGALGATTARFEDGDEFTLDPEQQASGWYGRLRAMGGSGMFEIGGEVGAEQRHESTAYSLRGTLRMGF